MKAWVFWTGVSLLIGGILLVSWVSGPGEPVAAVTTASPEPTPRGEASESVGTLHPGRATLVFTGAFEHTAEGQGVNRWNALTEGKPALLITSGDLEGPDPDFEWRLHIEPGERSWASLLIIRDGTLSAFEGDPSSGSGLASLRQGHFVLDLRLPSVDDAGQSVEVKGNIEPPRWPARVAAEHERAMRSLVAAGLDPRPFAFVGDPAWGGRDHDGLISIVVPPDQASTTLIQVRQQIPEGWLAFLGEKVKGDDDEPPEAAGAVQVVVAPAADPLDLILWSRPCAYDLGFGVGAILRGLDRLAAHADFRIEVATARTTVLQVVGEVRDRPAAERAIYRLSGLHADEQAMNQLFEAGGERDATVEDALEQVSKELDDGRIFLRWD